MTDIANIQSLAIASDTVTNVELLQFTGENVTIGTGYEQICGTDAAGLHPLIAGEDIDVVSSDTADAGAGTGARTVLIKYLDSSFNKQQQTVTLNGTTEVEMTAQDITYILSAQVLTTGTGLAAAGVITIAAVTSTFVFGIIDAGATRMNNCASMIPAGHSGYVHGFWADAKAIAAGAGTVEAVLQVAEFGTSGIKASETWQTIARMTMVENDNDIVSASGGNSSNGQSWFQFPGNIPYVLPAKSMVRLASAAAVAGGSVQGGFSLVVQGSGAGTTITDS